LINADKTGCWLSLLSHSFNEDPKKLKENKNSLPDWQTVNLIPEY